MRDHIVVFSGPSLNHNEGRDILDARYFPPAKQGDIYKAYVEYKPQIIILIDGYFECVPSPWHKEILYLMSQNVVMIGASSMGALRAAELYQFGMIGIGEIYNSFKNGKITDDDEVAIVHAQGSFGYKPLSIAMVDIRQTLDKAKRLKIIREDLIDDLILFYKSTFYKKRLYDIGFQYLHRLGYGNDAKILQEWIQDNKIEQKKNDAILALTSVSNTSFNRNTIDWNFNNTVFWHNLKSIIEGDK